MVSRGRYSRVETILALLFAGFFISVSMFLIAVYSGVDPALAFFIFPLVFAAAFGISFSLTAKGAVVRGSRR